MIEKIYPKDQWVPAEPHEVEALLDAANIKNGESLVDLGSGDGRIVNAAILRGAIAFGIEYDKKWVEKSRILVSDPRIIIEGDYMELSWSTYNVIIANVDELRWLPTVIEKFKREAPPGARLVALRGIGPDVIEV